MGKRRGSDDQPQVESYWIVRGLGMDFGVTSILAVNRYEDQRQGPGPAKGSAFALEPQHRLAHGLAYEVVGFGVGVPVVALIGGGEFLVAPEVAGGHEGDGALEFGVGGDGGLGLHQRESAGVGFFWAGHAGLGDDEG